MGSNEIITTYYFPGQLADVITDIGTLAYTISG
jgi:hypothetical protein